jgi:hypothetical protein
VAAVGRAAPLLLGDAGTVAIAAERLFGMTHAMRGDSSSTVAAVLGTEGGAVVVVLGGAEQVGAQLGALAWF